MTHSLEIAVADGTVTEDAARHGLCLEDVRRLAEAHPRVPLLVRLRSRHGENRTVFAAKDLVAWQEAPTPHMRDRKLWYYAEIFSVVALRMSA